MKYQYFKGDFTVVETFKRDGAAVPVPDRVIVYYFTKKYAGRVVCERNGDSFRNCRLSADGMSLICSVALSRKPIGMGLLCHNVIEVAENEAFPRSEQFLPIPEVVVSDGDNVMIYDGPSDNTNEIISGVVLAKLVNTENIFIATYGVTQQAEIAAAVAAGKMVFCRISDKGLIPLNSFEVSDGGISFFVGFAPEVSTSTTYGVVKVVRNNDGWVYQEEDWEDVVASMDEIDALFEDQDINPDLTAPSDLSD